MTCSRLLYRSPLAVLAACVLFVLLADQGRLRLRAQASGPPPASIPRQPSTAIDGVIEGGTRPQVIATGLKGADDPVWVPDVGLLFSEPNANRIVRLWLDDEFTTFVAGLHTPLGMTVDARDGLPFSRPNGVTVDRNGGVYFSDPGLAPAQEEALRKTQPRLPAAVYYVPPGGAPIRVAEGIARPNGVHLSRDERTLYVNDTNG